MRARPHARLAEGKYLWIFIHEGLDEGHLRRVATALRPRGLVRVMVVVSGVVIPRAEEPEDGHLVAQRAGEV